MMNAAADWKAVLSVMSDAFSTGDNPRGEELLWTALDAGAPWDIATSTVAQALAGAAPTRTPSTADTSPVSIPSTSSLGHVS